MLESGMAVPAWIEREMRGQFVGLRAMSVVTGLTVPYLRRLTKDGTLPHIVDGRSIKLHREQSMKILSEIAGVKDQPS